MRGLFGSVSESMLDSVSGSLDEGAAGAAREYFSKPFEFLSLGLLAYIGAQYVFLYTLCYKA